MVHLGGRESAPSPKRRLSNGRSLSRGRRDPSLRWSELTSTRFRSPDLTFGGLGSSRSSSAPGRFVGQRACARPPIRARKRADLRYDFQTHVRNKILLQARPSLTPRLKPFCTAAGTWSSARSLAVSPCRELRLRQVFRSRREPCRCNWRFPPCPTQRIRASSRPAFQA